MLWDVRSIVSRAGLPHDRILPVEHLPIFRMKLMNGPGQGDFVDLDALAVTSRAWHAMLQRAATAPDRTTIRWVVRNIRIGSLDIETEPQVTTSASALDSVATSLPDEFWQSLSSHLSRGLRSVETGSRPDEIFEEDVAGDIYELLSTFQRDSVEAIELQFAEEIVTLTREGAGQHVRREIRDRSIGSITGVITSVSLNRRVPYFGLRLYDSQLVQCSFQDRRILKQVLANVEQRATIYGAIERDGEGGVTRILDVWEVNPLPQETQLPSMSRLYGAEPDIGGGMDAAEWVRLARGER